MQLTLYRILTSIAGPFIDLYLTKRKQRGKEDEKRFPERLGHASSPRPNGPLVWVHAASIGESVSVLPLIQAIVDTHPNVNVLLTTGTVTSAKMLEERLPKRVFHQYVPIDKLITVRRFLDHWNPELALWVESELWPNLITETERSGTPMIQINARISLDSFGKWQKARSLAKKMLECFDLSLAQSLEDAKRLEEMGAPKVKFVGNLKFDAPPLPADPKETGRLVTMIGERPIWMATSTHPGEEVLIAEAHKKLKATHDNLLTILAPRHPGRGTEIAKDLTAQELTTALRSKEEDITEETDIYIADTIGELGIFFRLVGIVFMGGSLVEHGGQNPLEAARLECAILSGQYVENFSRIYQEMADEQAYMKIANAEELANILDKLLVDHELQEKLANAALDLVESKAGVVDTYMKELEYFFKPLTHPDDDAQAA